MVQDARSLGYGDLIERPRLKAIGLGGAGCNTISGFPFPSVGLCSHIDNINGPPNQRRIVLNTDERALLRSASPRMLGSVERNITKRLRQELDDNDLIFLFAGLGGETGSYIAPGIASLCRHLGAMVISSVALPFSAEGTGRRNTAIAALPELIKSSHITITYPNDGLLKVAPNLPFRRTFRVMDELMKTPSIELSQVLTIDDLSRLRKDIGTSSHMRMGTGSGIGMQREAVAVSEAFSSPWFDFDLSDTKIALIIISGCEIDEFSVRDVIGHVRARLPRTMIQYGVLSNPSAYDLRVTILLSTKY
ncbi:MAG: hypothetical protein GX369_06725 [Euryarchaeota archaeon]|nr:hypothetical protein [Euryarchaeota archaeon]